MEMNLRFKELKKYISVLDRVSICMRETLRYENYRFCVTFQISTMNFMYMGLG